MTVTIKLSDEQAAVLHAQAAEEGLTVDAWFQRLAEQHASIGSPASAQLIDERPSWEIVTDIMKELPDDVFNSLPKDGASEHDHYLYGWPKRNQ